MTHSLLDDPIFRVRTKKKRDAVRLTLPGLLAACVSDDVECMESLRPHQATMFHAFTVSLAYMAMEVAADDVITADASHWRQLLRGLTSDYPADEPWSLLVANFTKPGFMQSPCDAAEELQYTKLWHSPQELDVLVASKSHDVKPGKMTGLGAEHAELWAYALISLHGDAAYMGHGNYPSMRKNGGYASRPHFRLAFERGPGAEFVRDLRALQEKRERLYEQAAATGVGTAVNANGRLLWLAPWGTAGAAPLQLKNVHPLCIEVARRVRLGCDEDSGALLARTASSKGTRVAADESLGVVGDPWAPIVREAKGDKVLNPQTGTGGFGYRRLAPVLFDRTAFTLPLLATPTKAEAARGGTMVARALGRSQGGTDGYLSREVFFPPAAMRRTLEDAALAALRSQAYLHAASDMQGKVLRSALIVFVDGTDDPDWKSPDIGRAVKVWEDAFDFEVDSVFFVELLGSLASERSSDDALLDWSRTLKILADDVFSRAVDSLSTRDRTRAFARARAEGFLRSAMRKRFPALFAHAPPGPDHEPAMASVPNLNGDSDE